MELYNQLKRKHLVVQNFPQRKSVEQVQSYLGLIGNFRKFILEYARLAKPLNDLLRKGFTFRFWSKTNGGFEQIKRNIVTKISTTFI